MAAKKGNKYAKGNDGGRPTKYKPEYNEQVYKLCLLGATDSDLADFFEVHEDTINEWKKVYNEFSESLRAGKKIADMNVAKGLYDGAQDKTIIEQVAIKVKEVIFEDGRKVKEVERVEVVDLQKTVPADFRNQQFWLKNRQPDRWKDKTEVETKDITGYDIEVDGEEETEL